MANLEAIRQFQINEFQPPDPAPVHSPLLAAGLKQLEDSTRACEEEKSDPRYQQPSFRLRRAEDYWYGSEPLTQPQISAVIGLCREELEIARLAGPPLRHRFFKVLRKARGLEVYALVIAALGGEYIVDRCFPKSGWQRNVIGMALIYPVGTGLGEFLIRYGVIKTFMIAGAVLGLFDVCMYPILKKEKRI
jgi:hypothetical protein